MHYADIQTQFCYLNIMAWKDNSESIALHILIFPQTSIVSCKAFNSILAEQTGQKESSENKLKKQKVKEVIEEVEATMTEDERKSEAEAIEEQMKAIMRLLEAQEMKNGIDSQMEVQTQLKLYM